MELMVTSGLTPSGPFQTVENNQLLLVDTFIAFSPIGSALYLDLVAPSCVKNLLHIANRFRLQTSSFQVYQGLPDMFEGPIASAGALTSWLTQLCLRPVGIPLSGFSLCFHHTICHVQIGCGASVLRGAFALLDFRSC